jgi:4-amino-4-deoxy-L-arabinose transferase-like glycosyltransferase
LCKGPDRRPAVAFCAKAPSALQLAFLMGLAALALFPGLGGSARLTYHEAFVAQGAREILHSGEWMYPTIGGRPWLEKPPLPWWLTAAVGRLSGGVNEAVARIPSALAAMGLVLGVAVLAARHFGPTISILSGAIQATTAWTVLRGRLAEADILLACMITWALVAFDQMLATTSAQPEESGPRWRLARWMFFGLLGATSLVKGIGFGAAIIVPVVAGMLLWQRDGVTFRRLCFPAGWFLALALALAWPLLMIARHGGGALALWTMHVTDRLNGPSGPGPFASEPWWEYVPSLLAQALPWTPLALAGSYRSLGRALSMAGAGRRHREPSIQFELPPAVRSGDRLLWVWTAVPLVLLSIPTVKNAHYAIAAQVPWSIWAALTLARIGQRLRWRGWNRTRLRALGWGGFISLSLVYGASLWLIAPRFDRRGVEWGFYQSIGHTLPATTALTFLYDDWDRLPYECPFGAFPHDLAVRLFYLGRPACWHQGAAALGDCTHRVWGFGDAMLQPLNEHGDETFNRSEFVVVGRERDLPELERLGRVETIARGPTVRWDRRYSVFRILEAPARRG